MSIPIFQFIPLPPLSTPHNHKFIFYICNSISYLNYFLMMPHLYAHFALPTSPPPPPPPALVQR